MAAIDKIYGTQEDYDVFYAWLQEHQPAFLRSLYPKRGYYAEDRPIANFSVAEDKWLYEHCPLDFVQKRLAEQYDGVPADW